MEKLTHITTELLQYGKLLTLSGCDIRSVETILEKLGTYFGAKEMHVFVISATIIISALDETGEEKTQTIRINTKIGYDFARLTELTNLAETAQAEQLTLAEFKEIRTRIEKQNQSALEAYLGSILGAGGFAIFFGGSISDGLFAGIIGILFCILSRSFRKFCPNDIVFNALACFVCGLCIAKGTLLFPALKPDMITIGVIMLPIPGIPITNAIRDMISGDIITGTMRFLESILITAGIAAGFVASMSITGV